MEEIMAFYMRNLEKARELPLGHYERTEAELVVDQEYSECREIEKRLAKKHKLPRRLDSLQETANFVWFLCSAIGTKPPKKIKVNRDKVHRFASACYSTHECSIIFSSRWFTVTTIIHETAHHVMYREGLRGGHHQNFLWVEELLFEAAKDFFKLKQKK
jgi:hypothetical protein